MSKLSWGEVSLPSGPLRYLRAGCGHELVVFLHAVGGNAESFRRQLEALPAGYLGVAPEFRGHGIKGSEPDVAPDQVGVEALAGQIIEFIAQLGFVRAHFVGVSMGGVVAQLVRRKTPSLVGSLSLASSWAYYEPEEAASRNTYIRGRLAELDMMSGSLRDMKNLLAPAADDALVREAAKAEGNKDPDLFLASWLSMFEPDLRADLEELRCPLLLLAAGHDPVTPRRYLEAIAQRVPTARLVDLPDAGHFSNLDHADAFNRELFAFLRETSLNHHRVPELAEPMIELPAKTTAHALMALLRQRGIEVLFSNSGTDYVDIIDAIARYQDDPELSLRVVSAPHENTVVSMAHGWFLATGKPAAVMGHVNVGSANMTLGIINAYRANIPMLVMAGRTPWLDGGARGARRNFVQWGQDTFDQASFREFLKWDYELKTAENLESVVDRALAIAQSDPAGPVYLMLPGEVLARDLPADAECLRVSPRARQQPARMGSANEGDLARAAQAIRKARFPLVVTAELGRYSGGPLALSRFAERLGIGVVEFGKHNFMNMPTNLESHLGFDPVPVIREADLVIAIECHVPFIPAFAQLPEMPSIVQIGVDPLAADLPARSFSADVSLLGDPVATLDALMRHLLDLQGSAEVSARRSKVAEMSRAWREEAQALSDADKQRSSISKRVLSATLGEVLPDDALVFNEYDLDPSYIRRTLPGTWFENSIASGLGWALGAALGAKLAQPDRTVVATLGDGSYLFNVPISAHFVAAEQATAIVVVLFNDRAWSTIKKSYKGSLGERGLAHARGQYALCDFEADVDYAMIAKATGGIGLRVDEQDKLEGVLRQALALAQTEKKLVLVDVRCERDG